MFHFLYFIKNETLTILTPSLITSSEAAAAQLCVSKTAPGGRA